MEQQNIKQVLIWVGAGVAAAAIVIAVIFGGKFSNQGSDQGYVGTGDQVPVSGTEVDTAQGKATVYAPGSSAVTSGGEIVAPSGKVAKNDALPGAGDSPQESYGLKPSEVPQGSIKFSISASVFTPTETSVIGGKPVVLTFTSTDTDRAAIIQFQDPSLSGLIVSLLPGETKAITFSAPEKSGDYIFYRKGSNARGVMHVR